MGPSTGPKCDFRMRWCMPSFLFQHIQLPNKSKTDMTSNSMIFLFRSGTVQEKVGLILKATKTHAQNLAKYATIYKLTMLALKHAGANPGKEGPYDTFLAGLLGGYVVFGRRSKKGHISSVSKQIVIFGKFICASSFPCIR